MGQEFPISTRDFAKVNEERQAPVMLPKEIEVLVKTIKEKGTEEQKAYLALSTTYGMRVGEMAKVSEEDIDKEKGKILVHTEKEGRVRWHLLPKEIIPYILNFPFKRKSEVSLNLLFRQILSIANLARCKRQAWHSIRRSLVTALRMREPDVALIANFMRWKGTSGITGFAKQQSWERITDHYTNYEDEMVDRHIFRIHPFLKYWE